MAEKKDTIIEEEEQITKNIQETKDFREKLTECSIYLHLLKFCLYKFIIFLIAKK